MFICAHPLGRKYAIGLVFVALGEMIRIWSAGHLVKSRVLTISGPFALMRNPLYVGSFFIMCGYCFMTNHWLAWAVVVPLFILVHLSAVTWEERFLQKQFGEAFKEYCKQVPRFIPRFRAGVSSGGRFSIMQVRNNREDKSIVATVIFVVLFGLKLVLGW